MAQQVWHRLGWENMVTFLASRHGPDGDYYVADESYEQPNGGTLPPHSQDDISEKNQKKLSVTLVHGDNFKMLALSECQNRKEISIWLYQTMLYPDGYAPPPNPDLTEEIKSDYREAAAIVNKSPRGACALLRLCLQKLCDHLGAKGSNINDQIGWLVREKSLSATIQRSLDVIRVVGNEAVHPGQLDLRDDKETALSLFTLMNLIADSMITQPKRIEEMFANLPESKRKGIEKRDGRK